MHKMKLVMMLILLAAFLLSACGASNADATPTVSVALIQTQAVLTSARAAPASRRSRDCCSASTT